MFDFKDEIVTDRKVRELMILQELIHKEAVKHAEQEAELKNIIKELHEKLVHAGEGVKEEYEKRIKEISAGEESLMRSKGELEAKLRILAHNLSITEEALKLKETEFLKIQHEKEEQLALETKHHATQIKWLTSRLE